MISWGDCQWVEGDARLNLSNLEVLSDPFG